MSHQNITDGWPNELADHFRKCLANADRPSHFITSILQPVVYTRGESFVFLADKVAGKRDAGRARDVSLDPTKWTKRSHFSNECLEGPGLEWSEREIVPQHVVFTFEIDKVLSLAAQVEWTRKVGRPGVAKLDGVYNLLSGRFGDFRGICANWSGNKSVHVHVVFATDLADSLGTFGKAGDPLRPGFQAHWHRLADELALALGIDNVFDKSLANPWSLRRLPNGTRETGERQAVLYERFQTRAGKGADIVFFDASAFTEAATARRTNWSNVSRRSSSTPLPDDLSDNERAFVADRLDELFAPSGLILASFDHDGSEWVARFQNGPNDSAPSTILSEESSTVILRGKAGTIDEAKLPVLDYPLRVLVAGWKTELFNSIEAREFVAAGPFADVTNRTGAEKAMRKALTTQFVKSPAFIVRAPEGLGKSSTIFSLHSQFVPAHRQSMYAFASYVEANAKLEEFKRWQPSDSPFAPVLLRSWRATYETVCVGLGLSPLSETSAARAGYASLAEAIQALQPDALEGLREAHRSLWSAIGDKVPVWFTVHDVAHQWGAGSLTRGWSGRTYYDEGSQADRWSPAGSDLALLVHDEIKVETFVEAWPESVFAWLDDLRERDAMTWSTRHPVLSDQLRSFENSKAWLPAKVAGSIEFGDVRKLMKLVSSDGWSPDRVRTEDSGEYRVGDRGGGYAGEVGRWWRIGARGWWKGAADRIVFLTTEELPVIVARRADRDLDVLNIVTPALTNCGRITVEVSRDVKGDELERLVGEWKADRASEGEGEDWLYISNRAKAEGAVSHVAARGSNGYVGRNVVQTMTYVPPASFGRLEALNAWCKRSDLVMTAHVDELCQSAGRNVGWRYVPGARHVLVANVSLWRRLIERGALVGCRYSFDLVCDARSRKWLL